MIEWFESARSLCICLHQINTNNRQIEILEVVTGHSTCRAIDEDQTTKII